MDNDLALAILKKTIIPSSSVNVACLPDQSDTFPPINSRVLAPGWVAVILMILKRNYVNLNSL